MKVFVKTLKGSHFEIQVDPSDMVADVKRNIERVQGCETYPALQQMLIHQGKVLKDDTTLDDNKVTENSFIVIMLTKQSKSTTTVGTTSTTSTKTPHTSDVSLTPTTPQAPESAVAQPPAVLVPSPSPTVTASPLSDVYGQIATNLVAGSNLEGTIQQILDMGGGTWDRDTVLHALRAAFNNPERAVEYLYSGIPEQAEIPTVPIAVSGQPANRVAQQPQPANGPAVSSSGPNANPLDLFPQGLPSLDTNVTGSGNLDFLRNSQQFRTLQAMVRNNPEILQPMLQELGKQNPQLMSLIQGHQADFLRLINEPSESGEEGVLGQLAAGMPQAISVTSEEREAIGRLEGMGFDRSLVLEVFFACNKNEELAANYLLDHIHEFEE